ncbi:MAG TPA: hypothetical protein VD788_13175, partial [Candidatus Polarisedimenticolaceae bacterium]|nr:hypothetical protein [Candidatus Polarisedimenticolaceae bacterium]
ICTNMILGVSGASLGIGLGLTATAGSTLVTADWDASGDAAPAAGAAAAVLYRHAPQQGPDEPVVGPFVADNYAGGADQDTASVTLDDFVYYLNALQLGLTANFEFGGILSPIPDLGGFTIFNLIIDGNQFGIPIGQHAGTSGIDIPIDVDNYALDLDVSAASSDPDQVVDQKTQRIKPGEFAPYEVRVNNLGSVAGAFDNFARQFSNEPDQSLPFAFVVNQNTDFDCVDAGGQIYRGYPYDGVADDCYDGAGQVRADRAERINEDPVGPDGALESARDEDGDGVADEDPVDEWRSEPDETMFANRVVLDVPAHASSNPPGSGSSESLILSVSPFRHPLTAPGDYAFRVTADSVEARALGLAATDPSGNARLGAVDVGFIRIESFFEPGIAVEPAGRSAKPGVDQSYQLEASNQGNAEDTVRLVTQIADFNQAGCGLATLGNDPLCPYRAVPTAIPAATWTTLGSLPGAFGPLQPLETDPRQLLVRVPRDWAGMTETTYQIRFTVTSEADTAEPAASNFVVVEQTVQPTMESMTRFIRLEVDELIAEIELAAGMGFGTGGVSPILIHPVLLHVDNALEETLAGDLGGAAASHRTAIRAMEAFMRALAGGGSKSVPMQVGNDWAERGAAILADLAVAEASPIASAPLAAAQPARAGVARSGSRVVVGSDTGPAGVFADTGGTSGEEPEPAAPRERKLRRGGRAGR